MCSRSYLLLFISGLKRRLHSVDLELTSDFLPISGTSVQVRWGLLRSRWS